MATAVMQFQRVPAGEPGGSPLPSGVRGTYGLTGTVTERTSVKRGPSSW